MEDCEETISEDGKTTIYTRDGQFVAKCVKTDNSEDWYNADGEQHRDDGPAVICYDNGQITREFWYRNGELHRDNGPATINYENSQKTNEIWYRNGKPHRDDGPAEIWYKNGQKTSEYWWNNNTWHRGDGPAMIWYENGQKTGEHWYRDGELHRDDGPAVIYYENGQKTDESWYRNGRFGGDVLAYVWLADIDYYSNIRIPNNKINNLDEFRDAVKGPLALELMRPLPIPIREAIYEHYCLQ